MKRLNTLLCFIAVCYFNACQQPTHSNPDIPKVDIVLPTIKITVNNQGEITVSGKPVVFDSLQGVLESELAKLRTIPETLPVQYGDEVLMGMRGEVGTEINEAIAAAKAARNK